MDINSEKTCPSCRKKIKQIAMVCIHCHVNLIQYKKNNPITNDSIDNSTQTTPIIPNEDVIQRTVKEPLIYKKRFILFICILIVCFVGIQIAENTEGYFKQITIIVLSTILLVGALFTTLSLWTGIYLHLEIKMKNTLIECEVCSHKNHSDSKECKNCGKELNNIDWIHYIAAFFMLYGTYFLFKELITFINETMP